MPAVAAEHPGKNDLRTDWSRASRFVLFVGLIEFALFATLTFFVTRAAGMSLAELQSATGGNLSRDQLSAIHPHLKSLAVLLALCGVLPSVIYILCSTAIRRASFVAAFTALVLAAAQLFVLGALLIRQALVAIGDGDPPTLTLSVLAIGTPMALLVVVIRSLFHLTWPRLPRAAAT